MVHYRADRPSLHIIHDHAEFPGQCWPGEECLAILLIFLRRRYRIPWGPTHLILGDFLCRHRWIALNAWQIAAKMRDDPFVQQHGMNAPGYHGRPARTGRTAVRQQIKRMREALDELIQSKNLPLDARAIIRSEVTSTGVVGYRIAVDNVTWEHWPDHDDGDARSMPRVPAIDPGSLGSGGVIPIEAL